MHFDNRKSLIVIGSIAFIGMIGHCMEVSQPPVKQLSQEDIAAKKNFSDSIDAQVWAKQFVEQRLKAPSTAKWQDSADVAVAKVAGSKNKWLVQGYVDSQNSYGAMLRMQYWATMNKKTDGSWSLVKLQTQP